MQGARKGRPIAAAPCTPGLWRQNRHFVVPSAYSLRLRVGRKFTSLWADPAYGKRFGDLDATKNRAVFQLTAKNNTNVTETDESPLEIGEPKNGRQGQDAMDGGLRRTETGRRVSPCRRLES